MLGFHGVGLSETHRWTQGLRFGRVYIGLKEDLSLEMVQACRVEGLGLEILGFRKAPKDCGFETV